jgi:hypothetical protein
VKSLCGIENIPNAHQSKLLLKIDPQDGESSTRGTTMLFSLNATIM